MNTQRAQELGRAIALYTRTRSEFLIAIGVGGSNRDPLAEFSEVLVAALLDGRLAASRVQRGYDLIDPAERRVQVKYLANPSSGWINEHVVRFVAETDAYALVLFEDLMPTAVITFSRLQLADVCRRLAKSHPEQELTLQFTQANARTILTHQEEFAVLGVQVFLPESWIAP